MTILFGFTEYSDLEIQIRDQH